MTNGIILCKCGHEVADVPEPHPRWGCPACKRMGAFEWLEECGGMIMNDGSIMALIMREHKDE